MGMRAMTHSAKDTERLPTTAYYDVTLNSVCNGYSKYLLDGSVDQIFELTSEW